MVPLLPQMNTADLRTKGYELSATWHDNLKIFGHNLSYSVSANLSNYDARITRYDNPEKVFAKSYYPGMKLGEIWGYHVDGLFASDEEAAQYSSQGDLELLPRIFLKEHGGQVILNLLILMGMVRYL